MWDEDVGQNVIHGKYQAGIILKSGMADLHDSITNEAGAVFIRTISMG